MALPALALGAGLGGFINGLFSFFAEYFSKRVAAHIAIGAALLAMFSVFTIIVTTALSALIVGLPPALQSPLAIIPGNLGACLSALQTARVAKFAWTWKRDLLTTKMPY